MEEEGPTQPTHALLKIDGQQVQTAACLALSGSAQPFPCYPVLSCPVLSPTRQRRESDNQRERKKGFKNQQNTQKLRERTLGPPLVESCPHYGLLSKPKKRAKKRARRYQALLSNSPARLLFFALCLSQRVIAPTPTRASRACDHAGGAAHVQDVAMLGTLSLAGPSRAGAWWWTRWTWWTWWTLIAASSCSRCL